MNNNDYTPTDEVVAIHYTHGASGRRQTQDDYDRWQLDLLFHYLPSLCGDDKKRAERSIRILKKRIAKRRVDEIELEEQNNA